MNLMARRKIIRANIGAPKAADRIDSMFFYFAGFLGWLSREFTNPEAEQVERAIYNYNEAMNA